MQFTILWIIILGIVGCGESQKTQNQEVLQLQTSELNPAFLAWDNSSNFQKIQNSYERARGYIPPLHKPTVHTPTTSHQKLLGGSSSASKFDLRDPNLDGDRNDSDVTSVKDQGQCGSC